MTSTTFLGTGAMGGVLAAAVLDAGRPVTVWNRSQDRAQWLGERGATVAATVTEAVTGAEVTVVCLFDHRSVREVLDPVADRLSGRTLVNLTTTTPDQARELATWAATHQIDYLDGAIMAVPAMIGGPGSAVLYSGSATAFDTHRGLLDRSGASSHLGADAGLASLYDLAILAGMYAMFAGFSHGAAMVAADGVSATDFATRAAPFLAAMTGSLAGSAAVIDAGNYAGEGQQSLEFTRVALETIMQASRDQGVSTEVLRPIHDLVHRQIAAGRGTQGSDRIFEELRRPR
ncbi:NAD(P)-dependent oxidoreductase [Micromonospora endophytica]|nr:NAD(P)-binding domain-containing protein [Micromonospora endophytica]BCJ62459.1 oxidoreductase [Micromonospora endophytica]